MNSSEVLIVKDVTRTSSWAQAFFEEDSRDWRICCWVAGKVWSTLQLQHTLFLLGDAMPVVNPDYWECSLLSYGTWVFSTI